MVSANQLGHLENNSVCVERELGGGEVRGIKEASHELRESKRDSPDADTRQGNYNFRRVGFCFGPKRN